MTTDSALPTTFWQAVHDNFELAAAGCTLGCDTGMRYATGSHLRTLLQIRAAESVGTPWLVRSVAQATHVNGAEAATNAAEMTQSRIFFLI
jgi:hypothetical protein